MKGLLAVLPASGAVPGVWPWEGLEHGLCLREVQGAGALFSRLVKRAGPRSLLGTPSHLFTWESFHPVSPCRTNTGLAGWAGCRVLAGPLQVGGGEDPVWRQPLRWVTLPARLHLLLIVAARRWALLSAHLPSYVKN